MKNIYTCYNFLCIDSSYQRIVLNVSLHCYSRESRGRGPACSLGVEGVGRKRVRGYGKWSGKGAEDARGWQQGVQGKTLQTSLGSQVLQFNLEKEMVIALYSEVVYYFGTTPASEKLHP